MLNGEYTTPIPRTTIGCMKCDFVSYVSASYGVHVCMYITYNMYLYFVFIQYEACYHVA